MKRGRKPKPHKLRLLQGKAAKRVKGEVVKNVGSVAVLPPAMPRHLSKLAEYEWRRVVPLLHVAGILHKVDRAMLAAYCQAWGTWVNAIGQIDKTGAVVKTKNGYPIPNPFNKVAKEAFETMLKIGREFGLTPAARLGLDFAIDDGSKESEAERFARHHFG